MYPYWRHNLPLSLEIMTHDFKDSHFSNFPKLIIHIIWRLIASPIIFFFYVFHPRRRFCAIIENRSCFYLKLAFYAASPERRRCQNNLKQFLLSLSGEKTRLPERPCDDICHYEPSSKGIKGIFD